MAPAPHVERFKGMDWEECDDFISAIRARALWEGKQRDPAWIADFAAPLFSRAALSWHSRLPEDVRQDWSKLEIALLDRWPPPGDDSRAQPTPAPAPAPAPSRDDKAIRSRQGLLTLVVEGSNRKYYVRLCNDGDVFQTTDDVTKAIHVRCSTLSSATLLEWTDHSRHSWLAAHFSKPTPKIGDGSINHARITYVDADNLRSSWNWNGPWKLMPCTVSANGEVIPTWEKDSASKITFFPFLGGINIYLATDSAAYTREYPSEKAAKLIIEFTD